ncbi:MFS transporter [Streptomyces sp. NPDC047821]|uniref:MFS transporter n=1 Tax=Streptomyces sp. NPDC047821 TaxID=3365488 RepID=UPI00371DE7E5
MRGRREVLATLHVTFDEGSRAKAFGLYGTVMSLGSVIGPVLGGVLTQADLFSLSWRPIFLINLPIGIAAVILGLRFLPESHDRTAQRLDPLGMSLSALGLLLTKTVKTGGYWYEPRLSGSTHDTQRFSRVECSKASVPPPSEPRRACGPYGAQARPPTAHSTPPSPRPDRASW